MEGQVQVRSGTDWQGRQGKFRNGRVWHGRAGCGDVRFGLAWHAYKSINHTKEETKWFIRNGTSGVL